MRLGAFATAGVYGPGNLWHLLLDNGVHDSTGGQATVSPRISFAEVAAGCRYASALETDQLDRIGAWLHEPALEGARFARLFIRPGRPPVCAPERHARRGEDASDAAHRCASGAL